MTYFKNKTVIMSGGSRGVGLEIAKALGKDGANIAREGGLDVVMDRCMKVEHARYLGRMHWLGFNTGRIAALRGARFF